MHSNNFRYYEFNNFKIDVRRRVLTRNNEQVPISAKNFDLLLALIQNEGRILSHDELLDLVWGDTFVEQSNLKKGISAIRQILGETPDSSLYIKTIPRKGYSFIAPIQAIPDEQEFQIKATEIVIEEEIIEDSEPPNLNSPAKPVLNGKPESFFHKFKLPILVGIVLLTVSAIGLWLWKGSRGNSFASQLSLEKLKIQRISTNGNVIEAALSPDGKFIVYALADEINKQSLWMRKIGVMNPLQLMPPMAGDFRSIEISPDNNLVYYGLTTENSKHTLYQIPIFGGNPRKITENQTSPVTFSPDGKRIAFLRDEFNVGRVLITANAEDGSDERVIYTETGDNHGIITPKWSPDGSKFAFVASERLPNGRIWKLCEIPATGGQIRNIIEPRTGKIWELSWLKDGSGLVISAEVNDARQSQLWRVDLPQGELHRLSNDVNEYFKINVSEEGNTILAIQNERKGDLWSADYSNPANATQITRNINLPNRFTILPDGNFLAEQVENGIQTLSVINADGSKPRPFFSQSNIDRAPNVSADGKSVVFISRRSGDDQVWIGDINGNNLRKLTNINSFVMHPRFSPDNKSIYFQQYSGLIWQIVKMPLEGGEVTPISDKPTNNYDFSPDRKLFAYSYFENDVRKWKLSVNNLADDTLIKFYDVASSTIVRFTPDGKGLLYNTSDIKNDGGNLWIQPLDGNPPKPFIELKNEKIYWVDFSPDGKKLFYTRGQTNSNIVLINKEIPK